MTRDVSANVAGRGEPSAEPVLIDAVVQSGSAEIAYRRAGRGRPVILLAPGVDPAVEALAIRLARERFVVVPARLPAVGEWATWVETIVEGLGLVSPDVIVGPEARREVEGFAASHRGWVGGVYDVETIDP